MLTLDVARVHDEALVTLDLFSTRDDMMKRTEAFFAETITPLERTHKAARKAKAQVRQLKQTLGERTMELAASRRIPKSVHPNHLAGAGDKREEDLFDGNDLEVRLRIEALAHKLGLAE